MNKAKFGKVGLVQKSIKKNGEKWKINWKKIKKRMNGERHG
jgi:hypothetical protein|tara:strand:- start:610 stop:732 length:123 start_codon:yes stop_codon:yes gene_type:complete